MKMPARFRPPAAASLRVIVCALAVGAASAQAGFVTWNAPRTIASDTDVSTAGTLVVAHNLGGAGNASATLNGVTFTPFATSGTVNTLGNVRLSASANILGDNSSFGDFVPPFTNLSADYQRLLQSGSYTTGAFPPPSVTLTLSGLDVGMPYQFQWWVHEASSSSFAPPPGIPTTTATAGSSVTLSRNGFTEGSLGQFAIGTFTADAASQVITFNGSDTKTLLNAFQLRALPAAVIPEPGAGLFALALCGVALRSFSSRRRPGTPTLAG